MRLFLASWWPRRAKAEELARQYEAARADYPLVFADLARFCNAGDSVLEKSPDGRIDTDATTASAAMRDVWLHVQEMAKIDEGDLSNLLEETEA